MAFRALRRTAAEIDEHRDPIGTEGPGDAPTDAARSASRRGFLARVATGGAVAVGASAVSIASGSPMAFAQTDGTEPPADAGAPGTTAAAAPAAKGEPPLIGGTDLVIVVFLQSIELAAVEAYRAMIATGRLAPAVAQTARQFTQNHTEHAASLAGLAGGSSTRTPNPRLSQELTALVADGADQEALVTVAYDLEERITATYAAALGQLTEWQAAAAASKILPVDSQQAIAWSLVLDPDPQVWSTQITSWIPNFQSATDAINITEYAAS